MEAKNLKPIADALLEAGTRVLLRLDLNVPCAGGKVVSDYRIKQVLPTLTLLSKKGCRTVIVSHLDTESGSSLAPVADYLAKDFSLSFARSLSVAEEAVSTLRNGQFLLVENIRAENGEVENDPVFSRRLAALADIFINDAFAVLHRRHASVVGVASILPSFAGFLVLEEVQKLSEALRPAHPSLFVLGGAKFETKLPLLLKLLDCYDRVFVGGALANDVFNAMGLEIGTSLASPIAPDLSAIIGRPNLRIPLDVRIVSDVGVVIVAPELVSPKQRIVDVGPKTVEFLQELVQESKFVLWNGPLGEYEKGHRIGTEGLAKAIANTHVKAVVGGGDTVASIESLGVMEKFDFISTGGGAMLEFLAHETLPGLEALKKK